MGEQVPLDSITIQVVANGYILCRWASVHRPDTKVAATKQMLLTLIDEWATDRPAVVNPK